MQKTQTPMKQEEAAPLAQCAHLRPPSDLMGAGGVGLSPERRGSATNDEVLSKDELAARLKVNVRTIERWLRDGDLPHFYVRTAVRFHWPEVLALLKGKYRDRSAWGNTEG